jgi:hypothetical protein
LIGGIGTGGMLEFLFWYVLFEADVDAAAVAANVVLGCAEWVKRWVTRCRGGKKSGSACVCIACDVHSGCLS